MVTNHFRIGLAAVHLLCIGCTLNSNITYLHDQLNSISLSRFVADNSKESTPSLNLFHNKDVSKIEFFGDFSFISDVFLSTTADCSEKTVMSDQSVSTSTSKVFNFSQPLTEGTHVFFMGATVRSIINGTKTTTFDCLKEPIQVQIKKSMKEQNVHMETFLPERQDSEPTVIVSHVDPHESALIFTEANCNGTASTTLTNSGTVSTYLSSKIKLEASGSYSLSVLKQDPFGNNICKNIEPSISYGWSGFQNVLGNQSAFAALRTDGSVVAWGFSYNGGDTTSVSSKLNGDIDVLELFKTANAFAALREDGSVATWGNKVGNSSAVSSLISGEIDVTNISSTSEAFAALREDGSVVTWGDSNSGGNSNIVASEINGSNDVVKIVGGNYAFAALRIDGSVVTWGDSSFGGNSSAVASALDGTIDVVDIKSTGTAFAAIRSDGSVITWGYPAGGGTSADVASSINGTIDVVKIYHTSQAFAALRIDGSVITWGYPASGGDSSSVATALNGTIPVIEIAATNGAFAAIRSDGSVITWGDTGQGAIPRV